MQPSEPIPAARVTAALHRVLSSPEFRPSKSLLDDFLRWIGRHLSPGGVGRAADALLWGLIGLAAVLLVWGIVRQLRGRRTEDDAAERAPTPRERVAELLERARAARAAGDLRLALRLRLFALVVGLGERGDLRYHDAWTNRELLQRGKPDAAARELLEPLVAELEPKDFGREEVTAEDVARLERLCERVLGPEPAPGGERAA